MTGEVLSSTYARDQKDGEARVWVFVEGTWDFCEPIIGSSEGGNAVANSTRQTAASFC